jgi:hypothetical protein
MENPLISQYLLTLLTGFGLALVGTPLAGWLGQRLGIVQNRGPPTPSGRDLSVGRCGTGARFLRCAGRLAARPIPTQDPNELRRLWGLVIGAR